VADSHGGKPEARRRLRWCLTHPSRRTPAAGALFAAFKSDPNFADTFRREVLKDYANID
jgi:hypothetical protein